MHSVAPQHTVTSVSGSYSSPVKRRVFATSASRRRFAPQVIAYWLTSAASAARGRFLERSGAGKSGKALRQVDAAVLLAEPGHLADHGFGEALAALGDVRGAWSSESNASRRAAPNRAFGPPRVAPLPAR